MPSAIKKIDPRISSFRRLVLDFYKKNGRALPWRTNTDPYWVLVSEIMLQQTQVPRGLVKFPEFIERFPTIQALAVASIPDVLSAWQGLGYNRRALFLKRTAELIVTHYGGEIPTDLETLKRFPGIGPNTAASILAFAYNIPHPFIETNVRTVFLNHFFNGELNISDAQLMPLIAEALDKKNTRRWHWALMDYGTHLKKTQGNASKNSRHYVKQTRFEGSLRQVRGLILKTLLA
ncbi:MAG: A/G-specific adenine glycosylase, partial [Candidatus Magasanikbacteria bacterium]|nr:A/G-specific adenine glycosylase [Candidatus Magasanikbacteria bacterium]